MSSYMADLSGLVPSTAATSALNSTARKGNTELNMEDFLTLMVAQFQNQTIDDTADTGEILNQMVQMQMITALTNMTDASIMSYAGSLVGKEVTIGTVVDGELQEKVVTITGTGLSNGQQVVFAGDDIYSLSDIMAVGRLPSLDSLEENLGTGSDSTTTDKPVSGTTGSGSSGTETEQPSDSTDKPVDDVSGSENSGNETEQPSDSTDRPVDNVNGSEDSGGESEKADNDTVEPVSPSEQGS